jgi:arylsulfatase A-like enzyme
VPFIVRWPGTVKHGVSGALVDQVDLLSSLADLTGQQVPADAAPDSFDVLPALLGRSDRARDHVVEHARALSLIIGDWKIIEPKSGANRTAGNETGNAPEPQLYNISQDPGEKNDLAAQYPDRVRDMLARLEEIRKSGRTRP